MTANDRNNSNGYGNNMGRRDEPFAGVNPSDASILLRADFTKMPNTTAGWARFERVKNGCLLYTSDAADE